MLPLSRGGIIQGASSQKKGVPVKQHVDSVPQSSARDVERAASRAAWAAVLEAARELHASGGEASPAALAAVSRANGALSVADTVRAAAGMPAVPRRDVWRRALSIVESRAAARAS